MFRRLLNVAYLLAFAAYVPRLVYEACFQGKRRGGWSVKLLGRTPRRLSARPCCWIHAVSVGEVNVAALLVRRMKQEHPDWEFVISSTTETGLTLARQRFSDELTFYCPFDFTWAVANALRRIRPSLLLLTELELWPNLIAEAKRSGAQVALVNGRLGEKSFRGYRRFAGFFRGVLRGFDLLAVQEASYAKRFVALGADEERVQAVGNLKFDGAATDRDNPQTKALAAAAGIHSGGQVILAGSTGGDEERIALEAFAHVRRTHRAAKLILVPRHPERFAEVAGLVEQAGWRIVRRTESQSAPAVDWDVLLIDVVGELAAWWGAATCGFVGGSLYRRGGQSMIEPAAYGVPVCFGPHTYNFRDVVELMLAEQAAVRVHDAQEMASFFSSCLNDPAAAALQGRRAQALVIRQQGAGERTLDALRPLMPSAQRQTRAAA